MKKLHKDELKVSSNSINEGTTNRASCSGHTYGCITYVEGCAGYTDETHITTCFNGTLNCETYEAGCEGYTDKGICHTGTRGESCPTATFYSVCNCNTKDCDVANTESKALLCCDLKKTDNCVQSKECISNDYCLETGVELCGDTENFCAVTGDCNTFGCAVQSVDNPNCLAPATNNC